MTSVSLTMFLSGLALGITLSNIFHGWMRRKYHD